jgi:hypothetical protein
MTSFESAKSKIALVLKVLGSLLLGGPLVLALLGYLLSLLFLCHINMAGMIESVNCAINVTFIETVITLLVSTGWFLLFTGIPASIMLALGFALTDKSPVILSDGQTDEIVRTSKSRTEDKIVKWILIILVGTFLFNSVANMLRVYLAPLH